MVDRRLLGWSIHVLIASVAGCGGETEPQTPSAEAFVQRELAHLKAALQRNDQGRALVSCAAAAPRGPQVPPALRSEVEQLCFEEQPKQILTAALVRMRERNQAGPQQAEVLCFDLFVPDALRTLAAHPPRDAKLLAVIEEFSMLCPDEAHRALGELPPQANGAVNPPVPRALGAAPVFGP